MTREHRCPKCASDRMIEGAYVAGAQGARASVGVERRADRDRTSRSVSTPLRASICGSCGFVELYADKPEKLHEAYVQSSRPEASANHPAD